MDTTLADAWSVFEWDYKHGDPTYTRPTGTHGGGNIIGPEAVGDPLFRAIHNIMRISWR